MMTARSRSWNAPATISEDDADPLDGVVEVNAQLLDKCSQNALEKGVDGQHREVRVVVQYRGAYLAGTLANGLLIERKFIAEAYRVVASLAGSEQMYLFEYAALHLLGGLVGKGHCEDVAVRCRIFDYVTHIFVGQLVCLSRACARTQNFCSHNNNTLPERY